MAAGSPADVADSGSHKIETDRGLPRRALMRRLLIAAMLVAGAAQGQQLTDAEAQRYGVADYLGDWKPAPVDVSAPPDWVVAQDGSGKFSTVQAALDALPAKSSDHRVRILIKTGIYRELICVKDKAPFTLYGQGDVLIVSGHYNAEAKAVGAPANPCEPLLNETSWGTYSSASMAVFSDDAQLANLTIADDAMDKVHDGVGYPAGVSEAGGAQAVALMTRGDKLQLQNVKLLGHQDTFFVRRVTPQSTARVYVQGGLIAGDVDFIFGNATLVIDHSTIQSRVGRRAPGSGGYLLAPSTPAAAERGFLVINSRLIGEPGLRAGSIRLGRAWDEGIAKGAWQPGSPNGQALVRDSELGAHLAGWGNSTSRRPYAASGPQANRFSEYRNRPEIDSKVPRPAS